MWSQRLQKIQLPVGQMGEGKTCWAYIWDLAESGGEKAEMLEKPAKDRSVAVRTCCWSGRQCLSLHLYSALSKRLWKSNFEGTKLYV